MNKQYYQPQIEIFSLTPLRVLCASEVENVNLDGGGGGDPWSQGKAPKRTPAF